MNYDASPEGICTGRLIRALLDHGFRITLLTSKKARLDFQHPRLKVLVFAHRPREPRALFRLWAKAEGSFANNFFIWTRRVLKHEFADDMPDIFYGRAWPYASLIPAYYFSKRLGVPFIAHLSDPIPPPNEPFKGPETLVDLQAMLGHASAVTITNPETVKYQQRFTPMNPASTYVLPHVSPGIHDLPAAERGVQRYYYIGAIGNRRPILPVVFAGFQQHLRDFPTAKMHFVNPKVNEVLPDIKRLSLERQIDILPFAEDIKTVLTPATALLSFEPEVENPIWTLTKTVEYLCANRCIFALTSRGSPTERMLSAFPDSCVVVSDYRPEAIAEGFDRLAGLNPSVEHFAERLEAMAEFKAENVAGQFEKICSSVLAAN